MGADPGEIKRSEDICLPVPDEIVIKLRQGQAMLNQAISDGKFQNLKEEGRTYCVRCLLWREELQPAAVAQGSSSWRVLYCGRFCSNREKRIHYHHCSICQRCVAHHDHHCGFFGRCIAGHGFSGNMCYFQLIIAAGQCGAATMFLSMVIGMYRTDWGYWIAVISGGYFAVVMVGYLFVGLFCFGRVLLHKYHPRYSGRERVPGDVPATAIGAHDTDV